MYYSFDKENIKIISDILNVQPDIGDASYTWFVRSKNYMSNFSISIFTNIQPDNSTLISIQTVMGYYELHNIKCWNKFSDNEVVFFNDSDNHLSAVFVSKENGIAFYANIDQSILQKEIIELDPSLVLSAMQLSIYNNIKEL